MKKNERVILIIIIVGMWFLLMKGQGDVKDLNKKLSDLEQSTYNTIETIESELEYLKDSNGAGAMLMEQKIFVLEDSIERMSNLLYLNEELQVIYGGILKIDKSNTVNVYVKDNSTSGDVLRVIEVSKNCTPYLVSELGLVKSSLDDFIEKLESDIKYGNIDEYTFVLSKDQLIHIYQGVDYSD